MDTNILYGLRFTMRQKKNRIKNNNKNVEPMSQREETIHSKYFQDKLVHVTSHKDFHTRVF